MNDNTLTTIITFGAVCLLVAAIGVLIAVIQAVWHQYTQRLEILDNVRATKRTVNVSERNIPQVKDMDVLSSLIIGAQASLKMDQPSIWPTKEQIQETIKSFSLSLDVELQEHGLNHPLVDMTIGELREHYAALASSSISPKSSE